MTSTWRERAATVFRCEKQPATGSRGMMVTNHPLASAAGAEMLAAGGNAVDAAVAALFALTVVEPMMVGLLGGGMTHIRAADGAHTVIDGLSTIPAAAQPDMYTPVSQDWPAALETVGRANAVGALSVAVPGNLLAWCEALARFRSPTSCSRRSGWPNAASRPPPTSRTAPPRPGRTWRRTPPSRRSSSP